MDGRFKQRDKHKTDFKLESKSKFKDFGLKTKEDQLFKRMESVDFASGAKVKFKKKVEFKDAETAQEIKIKSTSENLKVDFQGVAGTYSGYFIAKTDINNNLVALYENEVDKSLPTQTFSGKGSVRTHILPLGEGLWCIGKKTTFKVMDQTTGDEAMAEAIYVPIGGKTLWGFY